MKFIHILAIFTSIPFPALSYVGYDSESEPLYGYSDTLNPQDEDSPTLEYNSIKSFGTPLFFAENGPVSVPLGFTFRYYKKSYRTVSISKYGLIGVDSLPVENIVTPIPSAETPNGMITGLWYDYASFMSFPRVWHLTKGTEPNREFIVEWLISLGLTGEYMPFQVVLKEESGDIFMYIPNVSHRGFYRTAKIGIENQDGSQGISVYDAAPATFPLRSYAVRYANLEEGYIGVLNESLVVNEGGEIRVDVAVMEQHNEIKEILWDLDNDEEYDDAQGESILVSAAFTDGPDVLTPRVRAIDVSGNEYGTTIEIEVRNLPPIITEHPESTIIENTIWEYNPQVVDPGGDSFVISAPGKPRSMALLDNGNLRWQPTENDVGIHRFDLLVVDDDDNPEIEGDGDTTFEIVLVVELNTPPIGPEIVHPEDGAIVETIRPSFLVQTPYDAENDPLTLYFEVDILSSFTSSSIIQSGPVSMTLGQTGWQIPLGKELEYGRQYFWRVWANDSKEDSPMAQAYFNVKQKVTQEERQMTDPVAGVDSGCNVAPKSESRPFPTGRIIIVCIFFIFLRTKPQRLTN